MRRKGREVVYVERADSSAKWLFWGAVLGAGLALMYAPRSGEETRRVLQRKLWKLRAMTEEKFDELAQQFGGSKESLRELEEEDLDDEELFESREVPSARGRPSGTSAREELERRLAEARARRRVAGDLEEPPA
jgi:YtxH-like protein